MPKRTKAGDGERKIRMSLQLFVPQTFIDRLDAYRETLPVPPSRAKMVIHLLEEQLNKKEVKRGA